MVTLELRLLIIINAQQIKECILFSNKVTFLVLGVNIIERGNLQ